MDPRTAQQEVLEALVNDIWPDHRILVLPEDMFDSLQRKDRAGIHPVKTLVSVDEFPGESVLRNDDNLYLVDGREHPQFHRLVIKGKRWFYQGGPPNTSARIGFLQDQFTHESAGTSHDLKLLSYTADLSDLGYVALLHQNMSDDQQRT